MSDYIKLFDTKAEQDSFMASRDYVKPHVSCTANGGNLRYNKILSANGHEYVDLGLPSGTLWATCNVGAVNPEDPGNIFSWGDPEPYYTSLNPTVWKEGKTSGYNLDSYKFYENGSYTKYNDEDELTILELQDDAANFNWGGDWRTPTKEDFLELKNNCTRTFTTLNGVNGYSLTGINNNSIFLPVTYSATGTNISMSSYTGTYYTSSLGSNNIEYIYSTAWCIDIDPDFISSPSTLNRYWGYAIRPILK